MFDYIRDPAEIYEKSFATVRAETDLSGLEAAEANVAVRLIHACGLPAIATDLVFGPGAVAAGRNALAGGATVLVDVEMVAHGIICGRLPAKNDVVCTLNDDGIRSAAENGNTTRSAAAVDLWQDRLDGAVVAIGNAPTALFRLLELLGSGAPRPAVICGFPVGFVGAAESKDALVECATEWDIAFITLKGRMGGSALAAASVNALAGDV
ncbi:MAG: precorrin-8X methylmutase [Rhodospirillales bacterium]|nr:precorrin-8X methylmutase [Rhodospirillales bacterium]